VGFSGSFTEDETHGIIEAIERAEARFKRATIHGSEPSAAFPPWFVVKDAMPGQSEVYIAHRVEAAGAIVSSSVDELIARIEAYDGAAGPPD
jgi:hypothetical protein